LEPEERRELQALFALKLVPKGEAEREKVFFFFKRESLLKCGRDQKKLTLRLGLKKILGCFRRASGRLEQASSTA